MDAIGTGMVPRLQLQAIEITTETAMKKKWLVAMLSYVLPGLGYWYLKRRVAAIATSVIIILLFVLSERSIVSYEGNSVFGIGLLFLVSMLWCLTIIHSFFLALKEDKLVRGAKHKDPYLAMDLSFLLPGIGQFYVGDLVNGVAFLAMYLGGKFLLPKYTGFFAVQILSGVSSYLAAKRIKEITEKFARAVTIMLTLIYGVILLRATGWTLMEKYFYTYVKADGPSMEPTILPGDMYLVDLRAKNHLNRGDIVSCTGPGGVKICKRVVAFGGEIVEIIDSSLYVNGIRLLNYPFNKISYTADSTMVFGAPGKGYRVPSGSVYLLGDNSRDSYDSRYYGAIDEKQIRGVDYKIIFPLSRAHLLVSKR